MPWGASEESGVIKRRAISHWLCHKRSISWGKRIILGSLDYNFRIRKPCWSVKSAEKFIVAARRRPDWPLSMGKQQSKCFFSFAAETTRQGSPESVKMKEVIKDIELIWVVKRTRGGYNTHLWQTTTAHAYQRFRGDVQCESVFECRYLENVSRSDDGDVPPRSTPARREKAGGRDHGFFVSRGGWTLGTTDRWSEFRSNVTLSTERIVDGEMHQWRCMQVQWSRDKVKCHRFSWCKFIFPKFCIVTVNESIIRGWRS